MTRQTVLEWLADREPNPPEELAARIVDAVRAAPDDCVRDSVSETLAAIATHTLNDVLDCSSKSRGTAQELLVADSLVTYALEAQSVTAGAATLGAFARAIAG